MSLKFLRHIAQSTLPLTVTAPEEIEQVEKLRAALIVRATFLQASSTTPATSVTVLEITRAGQLILRRGVP